MTDQKTVGERIAARLYDAEAAIDEALSETAMLAALLPQSRIEAMLSATTGQKAFESTAAAIQALTDARGQLAATHRTLAALARSMGLETLAAGPVDKPEDRPPVGDRPRLDAEPLTATA